MNINEPLQFARYPKLRLIRIPKQTLIAALRSSSCPMVELWFDNSDISELVIKDRFTENHIKTGNRN